VAFAGVCAHPESVRMVFELDDQFDSYSDAGTLASLQYEMHLSERGQKVESVQRMTATGKEPASTDATQAQVLARNARSARHDAVPADVDWTKTPGCAVRSTTAISCTMFTPSS